MTPDSNSPSSFEAPMKRLDTAVTRPRIGSGVTICTSDWRTNTDTMSAARGSQAQATITAIGRQREDQRRHAVDRDRGEHLQAHVALRGRRRDEA